MPVGLFAQATCTVNGEAADCGAAGAIGLAIMLPLILLGILSFIGWLMMIIHAAQHDVPNKVVWIVLMVVFNVAWIIYYFAVKRPYDSAHNTVASATDQPASEPTPPAQVEEPRPPSDPPVA